MKVLILLGTRKGVFIFESDSDRQTWTSRGPFCQAWPMNHVIADPATATIFGAGGDQWFGPAVWKSSDLGESWSHSSQGLAYPEGEDPITSVWSLVQSREALFAGVGPAGLFRSDDAGLTWTHVEGLRNHPTCSEWQPGGAGLILHSIVVDPSNPESMWIAISAAGVFYTSDGGKTWEPRNRGTRADFLPEGQNYPEFGQCVHSLVMAPDMSNRLYQQNHCGMYRSDDSGESWQSVEAGLPSTFGFPAATHPRDSDTLFLLPLNGDMQGRYVPDAKAAVWRTRDVGQSWEALRSGLPQVNVYFGVLRQALATDSLESAGVYFGTTSGSLYASADEGDNWTRIAEHLPAIHSVETLVLDT